jgi:hypothetical protein
MAYQADIAKFEQAGAQVLGISVDSRDKNRAFAQELGVRFPILSDEAKTVSQQYGVLIPLIRLAKRTTFIIDERGIIRPYRGAVRPPTPRTPWESALCLRPGSSSVEIGPEGLVARRLDHKRRLVLLFPFLSRYNRGLTK